MKKSRLPKTDSITRLAKFWDTHDLTDFENELEEVREPVFARGEAITVPLAKQEVNAVSRLARSKKISPEELVRSWVLEHLERQNGSRRTGR